ncbi:hypothetical protein BH11PSE2_BH11PSE2_01300 [soil metagenome]
MARTHSRPGRPLSGLLAFLAALALLIQPAQATAMATMGSGAGETITVEICSQHTPGKTVTVEIPGKPAPMQDCHKCPLCFTAAPLALASPTRIERVAYLTQAAVWAAPRPDVIAAARAPPRPPSQAPPLS